MNAPNKKGQGQCIAFIREHVSHAGDDCLIWPFSHNGTGYGRLGYEGVGYYAHRMMCELVHGPAPTEAHEVAHSCGNGNGGCVNPRHLSWKTRSENQLDRKKHGTAKTNSGGSRGKLSASDKMEILALKGKLAQRAIAAQFNVHFETISRIHRTDPDKQLKHHSWWPAEDQVLREAVDGGASWEEIADRMGRTVGSVYGRAYRIGAKPSAQMASPVIKRGDAR